MKKANIAESPKAPKQQSPSKKSKKNIQDAFKYPFSVVNEFKHGHGNALRKQGDVVELMDKSIGRNVFRIKGSISANNFVEFDNLHLTGQFLHVQLCLLKSSTATFHIDVLTGENVIIPLSVSTLYQGDQPRFLGRSLRLPLPNLGGWTVLVLNLKDIVSTYCAIYGSTASMSSANRVTSTFSAVKKIQLCSNMLVRDVVTHERSISSDGQYQPKELAVKPLPKSHAVQYVDMMDYCSKIDGPGDLASLSASTVTSHTSMRSAVKIPDSDGISTLPLSPDAGDISAAAHLFPTATAPAVNAVVTRSTSLVASTSSIGSKENVYPQLNLESDTEQVPPSKSKSIIEPTVNLGIATESEPPLDPMAAMFEMESTNSDKRNAPFGAVQSLNIRSNDSQKGDMPGRKGSIGKMSKDVTHGVHNQNPQVSNRRATYAHTGDVPKRSEVPMQATINAPDSANQSATPAWAHNPIPSAEQKPTVLSKALTTPRNPTVRVPFSAQQTGPAGAIIRYGVPETSPGDRLAVMERLLGYNGGGATLLYDGRLLLIATGNLLIMIDLEKGSTERPQNGFWRAFRPLAVPINDKFSGYQQSFLRGHGDTIGMIVVSDKDMMMATGETTVPNGNIILWDLREGKRLGSLRAHANLLQDANFSSDSSMLVTVGTDLQHRQQIIVWDVQAIVMEKVVNINNCEKTMAIVGKQISEFDICRIKFSPFEEFGLVSCGRENIRFWRIRKGHLPGRPVLLNEYSRGYIFSDLAFYVDPSSRKSVANSTGQDDTTNTVTTTQAGNRSIVYVASNKGLVLKVNCRNDQVICAYQLHTCGIRTIRVHSGYAVTGCEDKKLRLWPMDFHDFLLEAQHEGVITNISISSNGRKLMIGTDAGTLGILNVSEHSYNTVLRSHVGSITQVTAKPVENNEFATVGADNTVRVWDTLSATQTIEFSSDHDQPKCVSYHPTERYLGCGFESGFLRVFDVQTACAIHEQKSHNAAIAVLKYFQSRSEYHHLATVGLDGQVIIYNAEDGYSIVQKFSIGTGPFSSAYLEVSDDSKYLAAGTSVVASVVVYETSEFTAHLKLGVGTEHGNDATAALTSKSPADATSSGMNSLMAPLIGFCFTAEREGGGLLLVSDKHLISIPLCPIDRQPCGSRIISNKTSFVSAWDERSTKRLDFGIPTSLTKDTSSGLLLLTIRAPATTSHGPTFGSSLAGTTDGSSVHSGRRSSLNTPAGRRATIAASSGEGVGSVKSSGTGVTPMRRGSAKKLNSGSTSVVHRVGRKDLPVHANSFVIIDARHKFLKDPTSGTVRCKLSIGVPQVYQEIPSIPIYGVCPCFGVNKLITVDKEGAITFWHVRLNNVDKIKVTPATSSGALSTTDSKGSPLDPFECNAAVATLEFSPLPATINSECEGEIVESTAEERISNSSSVQIRCEDSSDSKLLTPGALTKDFEHAVRQDPSLWSAGGSIASSAKKKSLTTEATTNTLINLSGSVSSPTVAVSATVPTPAQKDESVRPEVFAAMYDAISPDPSLQQSSVVPPPAPTMEQTHLAINVEQPQMRKQVSFSHEDSTLSTSPIPIIKPPVATPAVTGVVQMASVGIPRSTTEKMSNVLSLDALNGLTLWRDLQCDDESILLHQSLNHVRGEDSGYDAPQSNKKEEDSIDLLNQPRTMASSGAGDGTAKEFSKTHQVPSKRLLGKAEDGQVIAHERLAYEDVECMDQKVIYSITQGNNVCPIFVSKKNMMIVSDGCSIFIKYGDFVEHIALGFPPELAFSTSKCIVVCTTYNEHRNILAAVVKVIASNTFVLVIWVETSNSEQQRRVPSWQCLGCADLGSAGGRSSSGRTAGHVDGDFANASGGNVNIGWSPSGALLVVTSVDGLSCSTSMMGSNSGAGGVLKFTVLPAHVLTSRQGLQQDWDSYSHVMQSPLGKVKVMKVLPHSLDDQHFGPLMHVILGGDSRVMMISVVENYVEGAAQVVWTDDVGARGPMLGMDVTDFPPHYSGPAHLATANLSLYKPRHFGNIRVLTEIEEKEKIKKQQKDMDESLMAILDSCGSVKFTVFSFELAARNNRTSPAEGSSGKVIGAVVDGISASPFARTVSSKIPSANVSGTLRALALYPAESKRSPHFLALCATHDVRLFSLAIRELNTKSISVHLNVLYKVPLNYVPDYVLAMPPKGNLRTKKQWGVQGFAPHLLVANSAGNIGFVPNVRWVTGRTMPSECLPLQSPPLVQSATAPSHMVLPLCTSDGVAKREVVVALTRGQIHLYHLCSGIKLPFQGYTGFTHGTCLAAVDTLGGPSVLVVGTRCGRVAIFDARTMQQQELVMLSAAQHMPSHQQPAAANASNISKISMSSTLTAGKIVTQILDCPIQQRLLVGQANGDLTLLQLGASRSNHLASVFSPSVAMRMPWPVYQTVDREGQAVSPPRMNNILQDSSVLASVAGDNRLFGVIRKHSNILEIFRNEDHGSHMWQGTALSTPTLKNLFTVCLRVPSDTLASMEAQNSSYFSNSTNAAKHNNGDHETENICIDSCHVVVSDRTYVITLLGRRSRARADNAGCERGQSEVVSDSVFLFSGSVTIPDKSIEISSNLATESAAAGDDDPYGVGDEHSPFLLSLRQEVLVDENKLHSRAFFGRWAALCISDAIFVIDILKLYTSPPGSDLHTAAISTIPCHVAMLGRSASWAESTISLCGDDNSDGDSHDGSNGYDYSLWCKALSLIIYRKTKQAILKFRIKR